MGAKSCERAPVIFGCYASTTPVSDVKLRVPRLPLSALGLEETIMKKLLTAACFFVATTIARRGLSYLLFSYDERKPMFARKKFAAVRSPLVVLAPLLIV